MKAKNREEIFLKALSDGEEPEIKALTRKEILLKKQAKRESQGPHLDDLEGKPFYKTIEMVEILAEQTLTFSDSGSGFMMSSFPRFDLEAGVNYIIKLNGVEYKMVGQEYSGLRYIGNIGFMTGELDPNIPFLILDQGTEQLLVASTDTNTEQTVGIQGEVAEYHPMDIGYIPTGYFAPYVEWANWVVKDTAVKSLNVGTVLNWRGKLLMVYGIEEDSFSGYCFADVSRYKYTIGDDGNYNEGLRETVE